MLNIKTRILHTLHVLWSIFFNGLLTILPLTLTIALFRFSARLILGWLAPLRTYIEPTLLDDIPHFEIILVILFIFLVGVILRVFILRSLIHTLERLLFKIPLVRPVYAGLKQLVHAFSTQDKISFKKVVLVEFPRTNVLSIGFLTSEFPQYLSPHAHQKYLTVFIPTTPNPTSGYLVLVPEQDITILDITRQEAMAMIISGGIIQPEKTMDNTF